MLAHAVLPAKKERHMLSATIGRLHESWKCRGNSAWMSTGSGAIEQVVGVGDYNAELIGQLKATLPGSTASFTNQLYDGLDCQQGTPLHGQNLHIATV